MALGSSKRLPGSHSASVIVVHPGVQHSRELARALYEGGFLLTFITSIGGEIPNARWLPHRVRARLQARRTDGLPDDRVVAIPWVEIAQRMLGALLGARCRDRISSVSLAFFDWLTSTRVATSGARVVVGAESSCLHLFRRARAAGMVCVLDAASVHHSAQPWPDDPVAVSSKARIDAHKDAEIRLADRITVLSSYARETFVAAGVPAGKVTVLPPGVWLPANADGPANRISAGDGIRFLYVGNVKFAKGVDLLLEAFAMLNIEGKRLAIAGAREEPGALDDPLPPGVEYLGWLDRNAIFAAYARADILVLPSRADGFGFVVVEAMSSGLPVIVSSAVGAKDFVDEGVSGWIFESGSAENLARAMRQAFIRRNDLATMGANARKSVEGLTWKAYGERVRALYCDILEDAARTSRTTEARNIGRDSEHAR